MNILGFYFQGDFPPGPWREFAQDVMQHLLPPDADHDVFVDIEITDCLENDASGYCHGDDNHVVISISRKYQDQYYSVLDLATALAHELVHASQYIQADGHHPYAGMPVEHNPWEQQARELESELVQKFWRGDK